MTPEDAPHPFPAVLSEAQRRRTHLICLGLIGVAGAVTVLNESVRRVLPHAPRIEVIGERALTGSLKALQVDPPQGAALYRWTLVGDLLSNTVYYGLVRLGARQGAWQRGGLLGLAAGVGAVVLPGPRSPRTPLLTAGWYLAGGLAAAAARQFDADT